MTTGEWVQVAVMAGLYGLWIGFMLGEINSIKRHDRHRRELEEIRRRSYR